MIPIASANTICLLVVLEFMVDFGIGVENVLIMYG